MSPVAALLLPFVLNSAPPNLYTPFFVKNTTHPCVFRWRYSDGPSMVCDVFVCETYKAAGLFGSLRDSIQCTEFQNWCIPPRTLHPAGGRRGAEFA